jgi:O-antigen/teichoic acid export membrane protein
VLNAMLPGAQGAVAGGLFVIARKISSIVQLVRTAFAYVLAPLASVASTGKRESVTAIYGFATRVSVAVALPLGVVLAAFGEAVLFTFGKEARIALFALVGLTIARIAEAVLGAAVPIQQVLGGYRGQIVGSIVGFGVAAAIGFWLLPDYGLSGMTIAVSTGLVIAAIIPMWQLHHYDGLHPFTRPFWRVTAKAVGVSCVALIVAYAVNFGLMGLLQRFDWVAPVVQFMLLLVPVLLMLLGALWLTARVALPLEDRSALGKTGKRLRLY